MSLLLWAPAVVCVLPSVYSSPLAGPPLLTKHASVYLFVSLRFFVFRVIFLFRLLILFRLCIEISQLCVACVALCPPCLFGPMYHCAGVPKSRDDALRRPLRLLVRALDSRKVRGSGGEYTELMYRAFLCGSLPCFEGGFSSLGCWPRFCRISLSAQ